jgi:hypothetical protein
MTKTSGITLAETGRKRMSFLMLFALGLLLLPLTACGKKPGAVDPPPDVAEDHFPQTYPDPATDPKP